jgi:hypothetical protein
MHRLRYKASAEIGRLLRVLFLRFRAVPAGSGRDHSGAGLLRRVSTVTDAKLARGGFGVLVRAASLCGVVLLLANP